MKRITFCGATLALLLGCAAGPRDEGRPPSAGQQVAYATTTVSCGGNKFTISTGTSGGKCSITYTSGGKALGGSCQDGASVTSVNCTLNDGQGGCGGETAGSASCKN